MIVTFEGDPPPVGTAAKFRPVLSVVDCEILTDEYHVWLEQTFAGGAVSFERRLRYGDDDGDLNTATDMAVLRTEAAEYGIELASNNEESLRDLARTYARKGSCRMVHQTDYDGQPMMVLAQATTNHGHGYYSWPKAAIRPTGKAGMPKKGGRA